MILTTTTRVSRRSFCAAAAMLAAGPLAVGKLLAGPPRDAWRLRYVLGSSMYGTTDLAKILPEVAKTGAAHLDVWPRVHANQREQMDELGHDRVERMLADANVRIAMFTRYDMGPFGLDGEMKVAQRFGAGMIVCGGAGPKGLSGEALKDAVRDFIKRMEPHLAVAGRAGVTIGIENHANNLIDSPDAIRWLAELTPRRPIGIALAPYHLPQDADQLATLIRDLGDKLVHYYAWQHGHGAHEKRPKQEELTQMPGRGPLDFAPQVAALRAIDYRGFTEIFMHPVPRGVPILDTTAEVTAEINRARAYLDGLADRPQPSSGSK